MGGLRNLAALLGALLLGACSSIDGMPKPVIDVATATAIPPDYQMSKVLTDIAAKETVAEKVALRNRTIAIYLAACDSRYREFRAGLANDMKSSNLTLELGALGFSTLGAVVKRSANEFSAAAALANGTRGSINKELYFERTLPAIIATMDANRAKARSVIATGMNDATYSYTLEQAFSDLANYELAASIDGAVQQLTAEANKAADIEFKKYDEAVKSCEPPAALQPFRRKLNNRVYGLAAAAANGKPAAGSQGETDLVLLQKIAAAAGVQIDKVAETDDEAQAQADAIVDVADGLCTTAETDALAGKILRQTGETFQ